MKLQCVLLLVLCLLGYGYSNNMVLNLHHKYGGREGSNLSDLRAHDLRRHGRMLGAVDFPIGGTTKSTGVGLHYTKLMIGTPPKAYNVFVDTGSDIPWVHCAGCDSCPKESSLGIDLVQYDIKASSTGYWVNCYRDFCYTLYTKQYQTCGTSRHCAFEISYGEGSRTVGSYVHDYVHIDQVTGNLQTASVGGTIVFGCSSEVSGLLSTDDESSDGIIGFGQANSSFISQLTAQRKVKKIFSHCLNRNGGGILAIGQVVQPKVNSTPLEPNRRHYTVILKSIEVGGVALDTQFYGGVETIIDSGATFAYFSGWIYDPLVHKMLEKQPGLKTSFINGFKCFDYHGNVDEGFPVVTLNFMGSLNLTLYPHDYLLSFDPGVQCIALLSKGMTLLGDVALSNKLFVYDLESQTLGWTEHDCSSSIKVKDEGTGNVYTLGAHHRASSSDLRTRKRIIFIFFFIIYIFVCNILTI
ncbi:PREDICTED: aspartic proteinase-like protein 2 isoform X2 [Ipomoea nil]|uniref:aspartic proteinase-like protein 2 isoform X2 n=1 Tax=Ipomoea nil TaxID=35883 RepID=UPI000901129A|nr:PREDICTED: aspartic proteinase-like protein 2 isoform X2 [Ipomoea nil]